MVNRQLNSLQILRGLAALGVVVHHSLRAIYGSFISKPVFATISMPLILRSNRLIDFGAFGVDIFFVLSGFLMILIAKPYLERQKPIGDFIAHRIIRIWPLYASVTLLQCLFDLIDFARSGLFRYDLTPLRLLSFAFIPSFNDGNLLQPIIGPGWTLNYEMMFYICFASALLLARKEAFVGLTAIISILFILGFFLPRTSVAGCFLFNSIIFEFVLGASIAVAFINDRLPKLRPEVWLIAAVVSLAFFTRWSSDDGYRLITRGLPAAFLFVGMLRLEGKVNWPRALLTLGNASYSIYLVHIFIVGQVAPRVLMIAAQHGLARFAADIALLSTIVVAVAVGLLCYEYVEKPLLKSSRVFYGHIARNNLYQRP